MNKKRADEQAFRDRVNATAELKAKYGDAWDQVAKARAALPPYNLERVFFESGLGLYTQYFTLARTLVRWTDESAKPNGQRLPEYSDARKAAIERQIGSEAPIYPGVEQAKLEAGLAVMQQMAGADNPLVKQILAGKTPKARAAELVAGTKMGDAATRKTLLAGGKAAVEASKDPFIELARLVDPRARELRTKYDNEVLGVERDAYSKIAQAVFASQGDAAYPDGTFTLRLSYGQVKGYMENGKPVDAVHRDSRPLHSRRRAPAEAALQDRRFMDEGARHDQTDHSLRLRQHQRHRRRQQRIAGDQREG